MYLEVVFDIIETDSVIGENGPCSCLVSRVCAAA